MDFSKAFVILAALSLVMLGAAAYEGGGSGQDRVECNDGIDNDGDDLIDDEDPACTQPYYLDDSESDQYDMDATWIFSNLSSPDLEGPSVFYGSNLVKVDPDGDEITPDDINTEEYDGHDGVYMKRYIEDSHDTFGGGRATERNFSFDEIPEGWEVEEHPNGYLSLVAPPHPDAYPERYRCGDSIQNWGNESYCPEDYGFPSDNPDQGEAHSSRTISEAFQEEIGEVGVGSGDTRTNYHEDEVFYDLDTDDFGAPEFHTENYEDNMLDVDITGAREGDGSSIDHVESADVDDPDDIEVTYRTDTGDFAWQDVPDFYLGAENEIRMVYPYVQGRSTIGNSIINTYEVYGGSVTNYTGEPDNHYTSCSSQENSTCLEPTESKCTGVTWRTQEDKNTRDYEVTRETTTELFQTASPGDSNQEIGYDDPTTSQDAKLSITRQRSDTSDYIGYFECDVDESDYEDYYDTDSSVQDTSHHTCEEDLDEEDYPNATEPDGGDNCLFSDEEEFHAEKEEHDYDDLEYVSVRFWYDGIRLTDDPVYRTLWEEDSPVGLNAIDGLWDMDDLFEHNDVGLYNNIVDGRSYYTTTPSNDDMHQSSDSAVSQSRFEILHRDLDDDGEVEFISNRDYFETYKADGPYGHGDGFVAIRHEVENVDTEDEERLDEWYIVGSTAGFTDESFVDEDLVEQLMKDRYPDFECPVETTVREQEDGEEEEVEREHEYCVASVDLSMGSAWSDTTDPANGVRVEVEGPHHVYESLGVLELYNSIADYEECGRFDDSDSEDCDGAPDDGGGSGGDDDEDECTSSVAGEWDHYMIGPAVNADLQAEYSGAYKGCITEFDSCVLDGEEVPEGYMGDVAPEGDAQYEAGGNSPDWEICLNIQNTGEGHEDDPGGEWYDLDGEVAQAYLRDNLESVTDSYDFLTEDYEDNVGSYLIDDGDSSDIRDIAYYWHDERPGPHHEEYNPRAGEPGLALEVDCGNPRFDDLECSDDIDTHGRTNPAGFTYSFFEEGTRDEDYHPQGADVNPQDPLFEGYTVRLKDMSDQLEPGMSTETYSMSDSSASLTVESWYSSLGHEDYVDQWAIAAGPSWSVDGTGTPYPPYGAYHRDSGDIRSDNEDLSVSKTDKAFGNSYAAVAGSGLVGELDDNDVVIREGDGVWIDPDDLRWAWDATDSDGEQLFDWSDHPDDPSRWYELLEFSMDLTGPDSGLGYDDPGRTGHIHGPGTSGNDVVVTDIVWQTEEEGASGTADPYDSDVHPNLEPYMCGDDRREFLIEEMGEAPNSRQHTGPYGCAVQRNLCFTSHGNQFVETGEYMQTDEDTEEVGRLKQDVEYCDTNDDNLGVWYDQDYKREACRENSLYGSSGKRWFDADYVEEHPHAVTGGIDDSWNNYMLQQGYDRWESDPEADSWDFSEETPVDTGTNRSYTASLGFCGGDDDGEHLVTQECNTALCETDRTIMGVAQGSEYCVFDGSENQYSPENSDYEDRRLHEPGTEIRFNELPDDRSIACYNGEWFEDWPIVFAERDVTVPLGEEVRVGFQVVNVEEVEKTFEIEMFDTSEVYTYTNFVGEDSDSFTAAVGPQSSESFQVEIYGGDSSIDASELVLSAESLNPSYGEARLTVDISEEAAQGEGDGEMVGEPQSVPGIGFLQVAVLMLSATLLFYIQS